MNPLLPQLQTHAAKLGAYLCNALATGFGTTELEPSQAVAVALTLTTKDAGTMAATWTRLTTLFATSTASRLTVAHQYVPAAGAAAASSVNNYVTAVVELRLLLALAQDDAVSFIELASNIGVNRPLAPPQRPPGELVGSKEVPAIEPPTDGTVLLALIDHGCPFAHASFQLNGSTRVRTLWDQDERSSLSADWASVPTAFGYGRQFSGDALDGVIGEATGSKGQIDEDLCYRLGGYDTLAGQATHGAHVMGILAGNQQTTHTDGVYPLAQDVAATSPIAFVQLPRRLLVSPSSKAVERYVLDGLRYILDCASTHITKILTVVDYGSYEGPHDGSSWFELAVDALIDEAKVRGKDLQVFFPSGNAYEQATHARIEQIPTGCTAALDWWFPPANDAPSFLEIWLKTPPVDTHVNVSVHAPDGTLVVSEPLTPASSVTKLFNAPHSTVGVVTLKPVGDQIAVVMQVNATGTSARKGQAAPAGRWTISLSADKNMGLPIDVYVTWGGRNAGLPQRVHPTKLLPSADPQRSALVSITGVGTVLSSGCGRKTWVVGGYEAWAPYRIAKYSGAGPVRGGKRGGHIPGAGRFDPHGIDGAGVAAITEQSPSLPGVRNIGNRSGAFVRMIGTSTAAPQIARYIAQNKILPVKAIGGPLLVAAHLKTRPDFGEWRIGV